MATFQPIVDRVYPVLDSRGRVPHATIRLTIMLLARARALFTDGVLLLLVIVAIPLAILVVGTPIVLFIRLLIEIVERI